MEWISDETVGIEDINRNYPKWNIQRIKTNKTKKRPKKGHQWAVKLSQVAQHMSNWSSWCEERDVGAEKNSEAIRAKRLTILMKIINPWVQEGLWISRTRNMKESTCIEWSPTMCTKNRVMNKTKRFLPSKWLLFFFSSQRIKDS